MSLVLVIDDEPGFLPIMQAILERAGYEVLFAEHGVEGLALAQTHHPDIILLDEMMPGMSGGEVCTRLKSDPATSKIPIVMHSAAPSACAPAYLKQIGADAALLKPCPPVDILTTVATCLRMKV
jgi:two-component system cell cycle response regulator